MTHTRTVIYSRDALNKGRFVLAPIVLAGYVVNTVTGATDCFLLMVALLFKLFLVEL